MSHEEIMKELAKGYSLIPMGEITNEARALAVEWCENYKPMGSINLEQKHKLASDIMNYANKYAEQLKADNERLKGLIEKAYQTAFNESDSLEEFKKNNNI